MPAVLGYADQVVVKNLLHLLRGLLRREPGCLHPPAIKQGKTRTLPLAHPQQAGCPLLSERLNMLRGGPVQLSHIFASWLPPDGSAALNRCLPSADGRA